MWALSAIMYEMRMGSSLFSASKGKKKYRELMEKGDFTVPKDDYSLEFLHLLSETLVRDQEKRMKWDNFVEHPFFTATELTPLSELGIPFEALTFNIKTMSLQRLIKIIVKEYGPKKLKEKLSTKGYQDPNYYSEEFD